MRIVRGNPGRRPIPPPLPELPGSAHQRRELEPPHVLVDAAAREAKKNNAANVSVLPDQAVISAGAALEEWKLWAPWLDARQLLADPDASWLIAYCRNWGRYVNAERQLELTGDLVIVGKNKYVQQNPYLSISNAAQEKCKAFWEQFGGSPSARTRIAAKVGGAGASGSRTPRIQAFMDRRLRRAK